MNKKKGKKYKAIQDTIQWCLHKTVHSGHQYITYHNKASQSKILVWNIMTESTLFVEEHCSLKEYIRDEAEMRINEYFHLRPDMAREGDICSHFTRTSILTIRLGA